MSVMMKRIFTILFLLLFLVSFMSVTVSASETAYATRIDLVAEKYIGEKVPGACVIISEGGNPVFSKGYGFSSIEQVSPMNPETTVFEWGSISKTFVWVSVMQLEERGKVNLTEDIRTYLPKDFLKNLCYEEPVTLLHLMNHTAGFEEQMLDLRFYKPEEEISLLSVMSEYQPKQIFRPGEICAYSNWGASLAALIVEQISGQSYCDYVQENILKPLNMNTTSVAPFEEDVLGLPEYKATGYSCERSSFRVEPFMHLRMYPAGAMNGSAFELLKYAGELAKTPGKETVLFQKPETKEKMFEETWRSYGANTGLSHGFWQYSGDNRTFGHEGGTYGFKTQFWIQPDQERAILILTNVMETDFCSEVMRVLIYKDTGNSISIQKENDASKYTGDYLPARSVWSNLGKIHGRMQMITITETKAGCLKLTMPFGDKELLYKPMGQNCFYCNEAAREEHVLAFSVENSEIKSMSFRLAHDYVPASIGHSSLFTVLFVGLFLITTLFWLILLIREIWKLSRRKQATMYFLVISFAGTLMGLTCILGLLRWFSLYNIVGLELRAVSVISWICVLIGGTGLIMSVSKTRKCPLIMLLMFLLQVISASQIGFLTIV